MRKVWILLTLFAIAAQAGEDDFTFVILGDRTGSHQEGVYEAMVAKSLSEGADFYMTVGDQIEGTPPTRTRSTEWAEYFKILEPVPVVVHPTPGNHDIWDDASLGPWREWTGCEPNYSFDYSGVHFVVPDISRWYFTVNLPEDSSFGDLRRARGRPGFPRGRPADPGFHPQAPHLQHPGRERGGPPPQNSLGARRGRRVHG